MTALKRASLLLLAALVGCTPEQETEQISIRLTSVIPADDQRLRWSPKGEKLALDDSFLATLRLGQDGRHAFQLQLRKGVGAAYFNELWVDKNRDGSLQDETPVVTDPNESRGKIWSSFDTVIDVPVVDPVSGEVDSNAYAIAFWYVFDPVEPAEEEVIRFSRRGWMQGDGVVNGVSARILLTESLMDGVFDRADSWAIATSDSGLNVLRFGDARPADRHAWLGERAYRITSIDPSGRLITLEHGDVGISREEEAAQEDKLAVDRAAPRSGRIVAFEEDFELSETRSKDEGKALFIDFKTVWCGPCYTMDEWVFTADAVVDQAEELVAVRVDGDDRRDLAKRFEVTAYPTLLLFSASGKELRRHVGYLNVDSTASFMAGPAEGR